MIKAAYRHGFKENRQFFVTGNHRESVDQSTRWKSHGVKIVIGWFPQFVRIVRTVEETLLDPTMYYCFSRFATAKGSILVIHLVSRRFLRRGRFDRWILPCWIWIETIPQPPNSVGVRSDRNSPTRFKHQDEFSQNNTRRCKMQLSRIIDRRCSVSLYRTTYIVCLDETRSYFLGRFSKKVEKDN